MAVTSQKKQELIERFGKHAKDCGAAEAQVAILSTRITDLTEHLKQHPKDFATRRGLMMLVGKRRSLLDFLRDNRTPEAYKALLNELGLRK